MSSRPLRRHGALKSVCQSWLSAVVGWAKVSEAFSRMKAGLVIRSCAFSSRYTEASETKYCCLCCGELLILAECTVEVQTCESFAHG